MKKLVLVAGVVLLLAGCAGQHQIMSEGNSQAGLSDHLEQLNPDARAYVTVPADAKQDGEVYARSGIEVSKAIVNTLHGHIKGIDMASKSQEEIVNIQRARQGGYQYLIEPTINEWSDNHTFWTGVPDKISVTIDVFDVASGDIVDHFTVKSTSSLMPAINFKPYELLYDPLHQIASRLFKSKVKNV